MGDEFSDFGQKVDLTASIRGILRNYPEGTAILKELIQNADDAGARSISFCLDCRQHPTEKVIGPGLSQFQGLALMVYNDAVFTEEDFKSIQRIGDSLKKSENTKGKIGRFGIGFNAVYHWTDLPSFISAEYLVMLDPQARFLPNVNPSNPGKIVNWAQNTTVIGTYTDQFAPYSDHYGLNFQSPFNGTLFRLPLRTSLQAESSMLSKRSLSIPESLELLKSLRSESSAMLLFLKSIESIEIKIWDADSDAPRIYFQSSIKNITCQLRSLRATVCSFVNVKSLNVNTVQVADYTLEISCNDAENSMEYNEVWDICNQLGGNAASIIACDPSNELLRLVPWGGVAACINLGRDNFARLSSHQGLAYCFLPLPVHTGLPILINGFFELSSNRRDIWQSGPDMTGDGKTRADWNISLLSDVIASSYIRLLLRVKEKVGFNTLYQSLWPSHDTAFPWSILVQNTLTKSKAERLLYSLPIDKWISISEAVLIPIDSRLNDKDVDQLIQILSISRESLVLCEYLLKKTLIDSKICAQLATPKYLRQVMKSASVTTMQLEFCQFLLFYCTLDYSTDMPSSELDLLPILPLKNSKIGILRVFTSQQNAAITQLCEFGFSMSQSIAVLQKCKFNVHEACDLLTSNSSDINLENVYILLDDKEMEIFREASDILLDRSHINPNELEFLISSNISRTCNIQLFKPSLTLDLLRRILPNIYFKGNIISEFPEESIRLFLIKFWKYASFHPEIISAVAEGPSIVPSLGLTHLLPLSRLSGLVVSEKAGISLPMTIQLSLQRLGMYIVDSTFLPENVSMPNIFWDYAYSPGRAGIISMLSLIDRDKSRPPISCLEPYQIDEICSHISSCEPPKTLTADECRIIRKAPLFKSFSNTGIYFQIDSDDDVSNQSKNNTYMTINDIKNLSTNIFPKHFIAYDSPQELQLLDKIGVIVLSKSQYYTQELLPNIENLYSINPHECTINIVTMLSELKTLVNNDTTFLSKLKNCKFIPTYKDNIIGSSQSMKLCSPSELFDPNVLEMQHLLDRTFFPIEEFCKEDTLAFLRTVGLRCSLDWPDIISCAKSIAEMVSEENKQKRGEFLLQYLERNVERLTSKRKSSNSVVNTFFQFAGYLNENCNDQASDALSKQFVDDLLVIPWVPVLLTPPKPFLPWPTAKLSGTAAPVDTRPLEDLWFCSYSKRIAPKHLSESLGKLLKWTSPIDMYTIAIQLRELSTFYHSIKIKCGNCQCDQIQNGDNDTNESTINDAKVTITGLIPQLYQRLNTVASQNNFELKTLLQTHSWIWVGDNFVLPEKVAINASVNASPYLYQLPQDFQVYRQLLQVFGIKNTFNYRDYIEVLTQMAEDSGADSNDFQLVKTLTDENVDLAVTLATLISAEIGLSVHNHTLFIPDNTCKLYRSTELVNDDVPWLSGPDYTSIRLGCKLIHPNISSHVAEKLGVKSLRLSLVNKNLEQNLFSVDAMEAFGQAESLTSRLKTILDMYPDGNPIFSELIQNADDAGATKVCIMIDKNTYPSESLLDSKMSALQGPSIIVYNDAKFTEADYKSLARIGQGSKLEKLATTGRFGLGFSSTYHLTDTPTFVSGEHLVIFDPHCAFAPGSNVNQPGLRIRYCGTNLNSTFKDQFAPFQFFGCTFNEPYPGTLFRFPLRTASLARRSEISKRSYSVSDAELNLNQFIQQIDHHLLFLRNIKSIEIYDLDSGEVDPILIHRAVSNIKDMELTGDTSMLKYFEKQPMQQGSLNPSRDEFYQKLIGIPLTKLPKVSYYINIEVCSFSKLQINSPVVDCNDANFPIIKSREESLYMVVHGLCGGKARDLACDSSMRHLKLIPLGSVATCIYKSSFPNILFPQISGQAFCFLPLPVFTNLPIHVNAYWELSSNRRDIWKGDDTKGEAKLRSEWNIHVMNDVIAPLYSQLLLKVVKTSKIVISTNISLSLHEKETYKLFPIQESQQEPWKTVTTSLYPLLKHEKILWSNINGGVLLSLKEAIILEVNENNTEENDVLNHLEQILLLEKLSIVRIPAPITKALAISECIGGNVNPEWLRRYYSNTLLPHLSISYNKNSLSTESPYYINAIFLLKFCVRDVTKANFEVLQGIPIIPMEDGSLGMIQRPDAEPLYLTSDVERKLLYNVGYRLIATENFIGPVVASLFKDSMFAQSCNLKSICAQEVLKLIHSNFPKTWDSEDVKIANRENVYSSEWLTSLWSFIIDSNIIHLIRDSIPIFPVMQPAHLVSGQYAVKISSKIPILHMSYTDVTSSAAAGLGTIGIFIFDSAILGGLSYSKEILSLLIKPSASGILDALLSVRDIIYNFSVRKDGCKWTADIRNAIREFILCSIVSKVENLTVDENNVLKHLPVWTFYGYEQDDYNSKSLLPFSTLLSDEPDVIQLPPKDIDSTLLGNKFVKIRDEYERELYHKLGIQEPFISDFFVSYITNNLQHHQMVNFAVQLLKSLPQMVKENPSCIERLKESCIFHNLNGELCLAKNLFDPKATHISNILPPQLFPASIFHEDVLLSSLRLIGLNTAMTCDGVTRTVQSIHHDLDFYLSSTSVDEKKEALLKNAINRATSLLKYMESNIEALLNKIDPDSMTESNYVDTIGGSWSKELRSFSWVPVFTSCPKGFDGLPWPDSVHYVPLAAPSQCRHMQDIWLCSSTRRICSIDIRNELLRTVLGWNRHLEGRNIALHLIELKNSFDCADLNSIEKIGRNFNVELSKVYYSLEATLERESKKEVEVWTNILNGKPILWLYGQFIEPSRLAYHGIPGVVTEPYLFTVTGELLRYENLLHILGVKESFDAHDLSKMMRAIYESNKNTPLVPHQLQLYVGITKLLVRQLKPLTDKLEVETCDDIIIDEAGEDSTNTDLPKVEINKMISVTDIGSIFLPDRNGSLFIASTLCYDDAPWISSTLIQKNNSIKFIHKGIDNNEAIILGVSSLREQLFSGDDVLCPDPIALNSCIKDDTIDNFLTDIIALSDKIGATEVNVVFDDQIYPSESLMHPSLAETQGPSILIHLAGIKLSSEELSQMLTSLNVLPSTSYDPNLYSTEGSPLKKKQHDESIQKYPHPSSGKRLVSAFSITDCLHVISGGEFYLFDPCGQYIITEQVSDDSMRSKSKMVSYLPKNSKQVARAQRCVFIENSKKSHTSDGASILQRFPDQFAPFLSQPFGFNKDSSFDGVILRLPIRRVASPLSSHVPDLCQIRSALRNLRDLLQGSLLFSTSITSGGCFHWANESSAFVCDYKISLVSSTAIRHQRSSILSDRGWKRSGFTSLFSKAFTPPEIQLTISVCTTFYDMSEIMVDITSKEGTLFGWLHWDHSDIRSFQLVKSDNNACTSSIDEFIIWSISGAGKLKDLALSEPYRGLKLQPWVTLAVRCMKTSELAELAAPPSVGQCYTAAGPIGAIGLPYLFEGPFIHSFSDRCIPLSSTKNENIPISMHIGHKDSQNMLRTSIISTWNSAIISTIAEYLLPKALNYLTKQVQSTNQQGYYKYWPYQTRLNQDIATILRTQSTLYYQISLSPVFLTSTGFSEIRQVILPEYKIPNAILPFMKTLMPLSMAPYQISLDLTLAKLKFNVLSPGHFRDILKRDCTTHCSKLMDDYIVIQLLKFALSDIYKVQDDGEFIKRKLYREFAGVPLVPLLDKRVKPFPRNEKEMLSIGSYSLMALLPRLGDIMLSPKLLELFPIFNDPIFMDSLYIRNCSITFLESNMHRILPLTLKKVDVLNWLDIKYTDKEVVGKGLGHSNLNSTPSENLIYVLWKEILLKEPFTSFDRIRDWPIIPVISKGKRMLLSASLISLVFTYVPTALEDQHRQFLSNEVGRLSSLLQVGISKDYMKLNIDSTQDENWDWTNARDPQITNIRKSDLSTSVSPINDISVNNGVQSNITFDAQSSASDDCINTTTDIVSDAYLPPPPPYVTDEIDGGGMDAIPLNFYQAMCRVGIPFIDCSILDGIPVALNKDIPLGKRILECLYSIFSQNVATYNVLDNQDEPQFCSNLINFDTINTSDRNAMLYEVYKYHQNNSLAPPEIEKLKKLPIFTTKDGEPVAIFDCKGVFWCTNYSVLEGIALPNEKLSQFRGAVILVNEPRLIELYTLVGAEELTASAALRRFTIPLLSSMSGWDRLKIMQKLSMRWSVYSDDAEVVQHLKNLEFIPNSMEDHDDNTFRVASQIFSWTNSDLLYALSGSHQASYFAPIQLRSPEFYVMLKDLGMLSELNKDSTLRLAVDIENCYIKETANELSPITAIDRGRKLLRYMKENDRSSSIPFDNDLAKKLSKILFVPISMPKSIAPGGYIEYAVKLGRFNEVLAKSSGALGFSVMPILEEDICPPLYFFSSLGITSNPSTELVIQHIKNLSSGESLDRWNCSLYGIKSTFSAIFQYLQEHWKDFKQSLKDSLKLMNIIPIGHLLIKPGRLFFRLPVDLSPFMHEIPRYFGPHESLLKELGVKETPTTQDYIHFLTDLSDECGNKSLNPNELRAVVAIVESIASQKDESIDSDIVTYAPDDCSVLRLSVDLVVNDDSMIKSRVVNSASYIGLHFLHPLVNNTTSTQLNIPKLSSVIVECLAGSIVENIEESWRGMNNKFKDVICSKRIIDTIATLQNVSIISETASQKLQSLQILFTVNLPTKLILLDRRRSAADIDMEGTYSLDSLIFLCNNDATSSGIESSVLYINTNKINFPITLELALSIGICKLLDLNMSLAAPLSYILSAKDIDVPILLHTLKIGGDDVFIKEKARGSPGLLLCTNDMQLVEIKPYRTFRVGEIVAYDENWDKSDKKEDTMLTLRYGQIVKIGDNKNDAGLRRVVVRTDRGVNTFLSTEIYSFKSARELNNTCVDKVASPKHSIIGVNKPSTLLDKVKSSDTEKELDPIKREELMQTLNSLLIRSGIPLDLNQESLMSKIVDLDNNLKKVEAELQLDRHALVEAKDSLDKLHALNKCQICISREVTHVLVPCGHTCCCFCLDKLNNRKCPFCRSTFTQKVKLFHSLEEDNDIGHF